MITITGGKKIYSIMRKQILLIIFPLLFLAPTPGVGNDDVTGKAIAIDGDTLRIGSMEIGLYGIDAPELMQTCKTRKGKLQQCGDLARQSLAGLIRGRKIVCEGLRPGPEGYPTALCFIGPININENMVADGWAMADPREGKEFVRAETFAKRRQEGLWRGTFQAPWEWRLKN